MAVLHNQNKMVTQFGMSAWVAQSNHKVYSRSVTSCAGMTAFPGCGPPKPELDFLSGGRGAGFLRLRPEDRISQTDDAYARATVALTRAQATNHPLWTPGHEGTSRGGHRHWQPRVWCWSLLEKQYPDALETWRSTAQRCGCRCA